MKIKIGTKIKLLNNESVANFRNQTGIIVGYGEAKNYYWIKLSNTKVLMEVFGKIEKILRNEKYIQLINNDNWNEESL